jgi:hypothetical protein
MQQKNNDCPVYFGRPYGRPKSLPLALMGKVTARIHINSGRLIFLNANMNDIFFRTKECGFNKIQDKKTCIKPLFYRPPQHFYSLYFRGNILSALKHVSFAPKTQQHATLKSFIVKTLQPATKKPAAAMCILDVHMDVQNHCHLLSWVRSLALGWPMYTRGESCGSEHHKASYHMFCSLLSTF